MGDFMSNYFKFFCLLILILVLLPSCFSSDSDNNLVYSYIDYEDRDVNVVASDFVFVYNYGTFSEYKGDLGLNYSMFNDTLTGYCYHFDKELTRGIACVTNRKFDIHNFSFRRYLRKEGDKFYTNYGDGITLENGTVIRSLSIDQDLTLNQKKYFDDYDTQLYQYYEEKKLKKMDDISYWTGKLESEVSVSNRINSNSKSSGSFRGYTTNGGYVYGRYG